MQPDQICSLLKEGARRQAITYINVLKFKIIPTEYQEKFSSVKQWICYGMKYFAQNNGGSPITVWFQIVIACGNELGRQEEEPQTGLLACKRWLSPQKEDYVENLLENIFPSIPEYKRKGEKLQYFSLVTNLYSLTIKIKLALLVVLLVQSTSQR